MNTIIKQLHKSSKLIAIMILSLTLSGLLFGQVTHKSEECPEKKKTNKKFKKDLTQNKPVKVITLPKINLTSNTNYTNRYNFKVDLSNNTVISEKLIAVHPKVYISLCVLQGNVKVNGWERDEARVFIKGRKKNPIGFKIREKSTKDKTPVWVQVVGYDPKEVVGRNYNTCLSGDIELDVPKDASVRIQNTKGESETTIDSVRVAKVEVLGGDIYLNNISDLINANTYKGGVTVRNSGGKMELSTTTGNIVAHNTHSHEIGDYFKAKTRSGAITLQSVDQKEVTSSSISGSINYIGNVREYGRYDFNTTNGSINLAIPTDSSCQVVAAYGGSFQSELPLKDLTKERTGSLVFLRAIMGKGGANLNLKSFNGTISIRDRKTSVLAMF